MKLSTLCRYQVKINILWKIHELIGGSWLSGKIHDIYNEMRKYGHFEGRNLILMEVTP